MRVSTVGRYALRAMVDVALEQEQGPVLRKDIVARQSMSGDYLAHLFGKLRQAGLITSFMGPGGGYILGRAADEITAGDILRAVNEVLEPVFCVDADPEIVCARTDFCVSHLLWRRLGQQIMEFLESVTLADLCRQSTRLAEREPHGAGCVDETTNDRHKDPRFEQLGDGALIGGAGI